MARTDWRIANAGDSPGQHRLRRTHDQVDKGAKMGADLHVAQDDAVRRGLPAGVRP